MSASSSDRVMRSVCRGLGECICDSELPAHCRRRRASGHGATAHKATTIVTKIVTSEMTAESSFRNLESCNRSGLMVQGSALSASNQDAREKLLRGEQPMPASGSGPGVSSSCQCCSLRLLLWAVALVTACLLTISWTNCTYMHPEYRTKQDAAVQTIAAHLAKIVTLSQAVIRFWYHRLHDYIMMLSQWILVRPVPESTSSVKVSQIDDRQDSLDISKLRLAVTSLERRVSAIARGIDQQRNASVPAAADIDTASLEKRLTAAIEAKLIEWTKQELAQLNSSLDILSENLLALKSQYLASSRKAAVADSNFQQQLEHLERLVTSLSRSVSKSDARGRTQPDLTPEADLMPDYALGSGGALVVSTLDSRPLDGSTSASWWWRWLWRQRQPAGPDTVLTASLQPGTCWPFAGFPGRLLVKLSHPVRVSAVSVDHLSRRQSYGNSLASAPREFSVYGLNGSCVGRDGAEKLGSFIYNAETGPPAQTFRLAEATRELYPYVELVIHSNHGNTEYTCLYRFRVHGHMS